MSIGHWVKCDICGKTTDSWPEGGRAFEGWARIDKNDGQIDYCDECVAKMITALELSKQ